MLAMSRSERNLGYKPGLLLERSSPKSPPDGSCWRRRILSKTTTTASTCSDSSAAKPEMNNLMRSSKFPGHRHRRRRLDRRDDRRLARTGCRNDSSFDGRRIFSRIGKRLGREVRRLRSSYVSGGARSCVGWKSGKWRRSSIGQHLAVQSGHFGPE